jgi:hypothetical protein
MGRPTWTTTCRCGHARHEHEHYRAGSDCSRCMCGGFARRWPGRGALDPDALALPTCIVIPTPEDRPLLLIAVGTLLLSIAERPIGEEDQERLLQAGLVALQLQRGDPIVEVGLAVASDLAWRVDELVGTARSR